MEAIQYNHRLAESKTQHMMFSNFNELELKPELVKVLEALNIVTPTEIQRTSIPLALRGSNILATAETGSGKTAAFLLPMIERLATPGKLRALILAPTRELAIQIEANARAFGRPFGLRSTAVVGGESLARQVRILSGGLDILVATPGRLNDLLERRSVRLRDIEVLVLDEADRMLDMGFLPQVRQILRSVPTRRQTMLFTATLSRAVEQLAHEMMSDYRRVEVSRKEQTVAGLNQKAYPVLSVAKLPLLLALLKKHPECSFLVFAKTRRGADRLSEVLAANRFAVVTLHSDRNQAQRNKALNSFKSGASRVMVATDVAARGLDVDDISFVVNYEVPETAEDYIHRVGRTARAGRNGSALTLVSPDEESILAAIEAAIGLTIERARLEGFSDGRSDEQIRLTSMIGRLRTSSSRSFSRRPSR